MRVRVWVWRRVRNTERTFSSDSGVMSNVTGLCSLSIPSRGCPRQPAAPKRDAIYSESWQMWPDKMLSIAHVTGMGFVAQPVPSTVAPLRRIYRPSPDGLSCTGCNTVYRVASCCVAARCTLLQVATFCTVFATWCEIHPTARRARGRRTAPLRTAPLPLLHCMLSAERVGMCECAREWRVCACEWRVCACVHACVRACVCACVHRRLQYELEGLLEVLRKHWPCHVHANDVLDIHIPDSQTLARLLP